jgi:flavodoxin
MKSCVVYYTQFGNTKAVASTIAQVLGAAGQARALSLDDLTVAEIANADLVVFGSPTHYQNLPRAVRASLGGLPRRALRGKRVAAFDTSVEAWWPLMRMTAAHRLLPRLKKLGGRRIAKPATFVVTRGTEPGGEKRRDTLNEGEIERAQTWAAEILAALPSELPKQGLEPALG